MISNISPRTRLITFHFKCHYLHTALDGGGCWFVLHMEHSKKEIAIIIIFLHL